MIGLQQKKEMYLVGEPAMIIQCNACVGVYTSGSSMACVGVYTSGSSMACVC